MDITGYRNNSDGKSHFGELSLKKGYIVANGDENAYYLLGANSGYAFPELIHPEDQPSFFSAYEKLNEGEQDLIVRFRNADDKYVWLYITMKIGKRIIDGTESVDISFYDIMTIQGKFRHYMQNMNKYRRFLGLSNQVFYEYDYKNDELMVYRYNNAKNVMLFREKFADVERRVESGDTEHSDKAAFETFAECIRNGVDGFNLKLNGSIFGVPELESGFEVNGGTIYSDDGKSLSVGVMKSTSRSHDDKAYYLTEAARDSGTGLLNKRAISEYTIERINAGGDKAMYLAIMDVDDFKRINDTYGDQVLSKVSEIIRSVVGQRGKVGRFGGDEFFVLFENILDEAELRRILKVITKHILWAYSGVIKDFAVTTSIGISKYPDDGTAYDELFKKADKSLYIAKAKGKNRYIIYDEKLHGKAIAEGIKNGHIIGGDFMKPYEKGNMTADMIARIVKDGRNAIDSVFTELMDKMHIQGICVYAGDDMACVKKYGKYGNHPQYAALMGNDKYLSLFNENGINVINNITSLAMDHYDIYKILIEEKICSSLQIGVKDADGVYKWLICFDTFGDHKRKWSHDDIMSIYILIKTIAKLDEINDEKNL